MSITKEDTPMYNYNSNAKKLQSLEKSNLMRSDSFTDIKIKILNTVKIFSLFGNCIKTFFSGWTFAYALWCFKNS